MTLATETFGAGASVAKSSRPAPAGERRCIVSRRILPKAAMVRFVAGPDNVIVPDVAGRLPGRGIWVEATRAAVDAAVAGRLFAKAARRALTVPDDLADQTAERLAERTLGWIGFARRAGAFVTGHDKVRAALESGRAAALVQAADGSPDSRRRMRALAGDVPAIELFTSAEVAAVAGRDHVVHGVLSAGDFTAPFLTDAARLAGFRIEAASAAQTPDSNG